MSAVETSPSAHKSLDPQPGPIRVAVIGCGAIAEQMHLPVLAGHATLQLMALVDRNTSRASRFANGYGVPHVLDDATALSREIVDAAIVASPAFHHAPCTIELVRKGIHVLVEKPMATSLADAEQMVAEADAAGVVLAVGFFRRLYPSLQLLKGLIDSEWAGTPERVRVEGGGMYNWAAATLGNMRRDLAGGGVLIDFGSHMLDLMFALFDEPVDILDYSDNAQGGIEADCSIDARVRHAGRSLAARIEMARTRNLGSKIVVECERATLEFQANERFRIRVTPRGTEIVDATTGSSREFWMDASWRGEREDESWYATFGRQFDDWITAIQTGGEPILSGRSALATSRLIESCYRRPAPMDEAWVRLGAAALSPHGHRNGAPPSVHVAGRSGRVLVTGASGFIGGRVVELLRLRDKRDVRAVVHNPGNASRLARLDVDMAQADLGESGVAERLMKDCDEVIHCAIGTSWGEPHKIANITVGGTRSLAEAALAAGVKRFVHVSTMSVYGDDGALTGVLHETTPARPIRGNIYGETKAAAERIVLGLAKRGLPGVVLRPARVYGPYSNIFITRPLQAIAEGRFEWLGTPDVPADMVFVDNVAQALLDACSASESQVAAQAFNIGDEDFSTWRDFYSYFSERLGLDLSQVPQRELRLAQSISAVRRLVTLPARIVGGVKEIVTSSEFKSLGRRILETDPVGTLPRRLLHASPAVERGVRRLVGADDSLPVYHPEQGLRGDVVKMGSGGSVLSIEKLRKSIGYSPAVQINEGRELTLEWVKRARIV